MIPDDALHVCSKLLTVSVSPIPSIHDLSCPHPDMKCCAVSIYEVHLGSWRKVREEGNRPLTYWEMAVQLAD